MIICYSWHRLRATPKCFATFACCLGHEESYKDKLFFVGIWKKNLFSASNLPDVGFLAATVGDRGCEGSTVLRRHHIVDYRIYRRAEGSLNEIINTEKLGGRVMQKKT